MCGRCWLHRKPLHVAGLQALTHHVTAAPALVACKRRAAARQQRPLHQHPTSRRQVRQLSHACCTGCFSLFSFRQNFNMRLRQHIARHASILLYNFIFCGPKHMKHCVALHAELQCSTRKALACAACLACWQQPLTEVVVWVVAGARVGDLHDDRLAGVLADAIPVDVLTCGSSRWSRPLCVRGLWQFGYM